MHSIGLTDADKKGGRAGAGIASVDADRLLTPEEAANYLRLSISTLARWRIAGSPVPFVRLSPQRVGYRMSALIEYCEQQTRTSTSQAA